MSMALSFYTYWQNHDTICSSLFRPPSPSPELLTFHEESTFYDTSLNPLFNANYTNNLDIIPGLPSLNYSDILPPITSTTTGNFGTPSPEFQVSSFTYQEPYYNLPNSATFNHEHMFPVEYYSMAPKLHSELPPLPDTYQGGGFTATSLPPWYDFGVGRNIQGEVEEKVKKENNGGNGGGSLSAQSMAARVRRRKISGKTHELGRLIPGGHKMNTAEMFQAAFKYIKFLQAQIGVLKFMAPLPESEELLGNGELQALVTCTLMQEKLYTAEKCIVPKYFAETASDQTEP